MVSLQINHLAVIKHLLSFLICVFALLNTKANDTLTRAQVYNFNVGDTFDYKYTHYSTLPFMKADNFSFQRNIIEDTYLSPSLDTLFIATKIINPYTTYSSVSTITNLHSESALDTIAGCSSGFGIDTNSIYNGRTTNSMVSLGNFGCSGDSTVGLGLGLTNSVSGSGDGIGNYEQYKTDLIYFSKGNESYGSPYYNFTGEELLHYTPIPEECAEWISEIQTSSLSSYPDTVLAVREKIRTGNKVFIGGGWYVELIYTGYDYITHNDYVDSLIGYFRNDTANRKVMFRNLAGSTSTLYDFNLVNGARYEESHITLERILLNNDSITIWKSPTAVYAEGIGGLWGFLKVKKVWTFAGGNSWYYKYGTLKCFSVCGQTIFPSDASVCPIVSSIASKELESNHLPIFSLSPNPATTQTTITIPASMVGSTLTLTDLTGRKVSNTQLLSQHSTFQTQHLPNGIYLLTVEKDGNRATQKLVVGK